MYRRPSGLSVSARRTSSWKFVLPPSMTMSSRSRWRATVSIISCVAVPAGTMTQTARGFASRATRSATDDAPTAPCPSASRTFSGLRL